MTWDPYLDLQSGLLRNRLGITHARELRHVEAEQTRFTIDLALRLAESTRTLTTARSGDPAGR